MQVHWQSELPAPPDAVYAWLTRRGGLERLIPPWRRWQLEDAPARLEEGARIVLREAGGRRRRLVLQRTTATPARLLRDEQVEGPFGRYLHTRTLEGLGTDRTLLGDEVHVEPAASQAAQPLRERVEQLLRFQQRRLAEDLERAGGATARESGAWRIGITGSSGLIGSALRSFLEAAGHRVHPLVRREPAPGSDEIGWSPAEGTIDRPALEGLDAVVHLAGESLTGGRWTAERKRRIHESRVRGTRLVAEALAACDERPRVLVSSSGINYYPADAGGPLDEDVPPGSSFLAEVCRDWEAAAAPAAEAGIRVSHPRTAVVLSPRGGALGLMLTPFRLGLGGPLGSGEQGFSWIALDDMVGVLFALVRDERLGGAVNASAPHPVSNRAFVTALGRVLGRPARLRAPAAALRLALGREMADETILADLRVVPTRLDAAGFRFAHPEIEAALRFMLGR
jgi:hypothetical protein